MQLVTHLPAWYGLICYSTNNDVKMFVTVWEPAIRNQCATTETMALIAS